MTARCVRCGAPGLDPQVVYGRTTHRYEHLPYCPIGRVLRWPSSQTAPGFEFLPESDVEQLRRALR